MKYFTALFTLFSIIFSAQHTRFVYQVSMKPDSTNSPIVELAYLDVSANTSHFFGEKRLRMDSLFRRAFETKNFNFNREQMQQYRSKIDYLIVKDLEKQKITFKNRLGRDLYVYEEDRPMIWNISKETTKIGDYKVQKATTDFAGRKWNAWFTTELPLQDGPYKFYGLPGMIIKVEDEKGHYSFDLKQIKKIAEIPNFDTRFSSTITVKRKDYIKQLEKFYSDPSSFIQNQGSGFGNMTIGERRGNIPPQNEVERRKRMKERMKEEMKNNNNPLELN